MCVCVQIEQLQTAVKQKATKLKFLIEMHCNELLENLEEIREIGLIRYRDKRSELDGCSSLTEGFRYYAAEVSHSLYRGSQIVSQIL